MSFTCFLFEIGVTPSTPNTLSVCLLERLYRWTAGGDFLHKGDFITPTAADF